MKALRSFYQRTNFSFLRYAAILLFCLSTFTFPLFGNEQEDLTNALGKLIPVYSYDKVNIEEIERLLDAGADPNPFLVRAADSHNVQVTRLLLQHGADPNRKRTNPERNGAVFYGNSGITALFIEHGARFDVMGTWDWSPLMWQTDEDGYLASAILILKWEQKHSPDFCAKYKSRKEYLTAVLDELLSRHRLTDYNENVCILTEHLIDAGADMFAQSSRGNFRIVSRAVDTGGKLYLIPLLVEKGLPVDGYYGGGDTALYCAADSHNIILTNFLLEKGADINQQTRSGKTALMAAASEAKGTTERMIRFLLLRGADPNIQDNDGETALMKLGWGTAGFVNLLLQYGADPTIKDKKGRTVLFHLIGYLDGPMLDELISRGSLIDEPDNNGDTPLIYCYRHSSDTIFVLLEKGADPNYRDAKGKTALHILLLYIESMGWTYDDKDMKRDMPIITALLEAGTRPADKDDDGDSALATAIRIALKRKNQASIGKLVKQYANDEEIKIATVSARETVSAKKREETKAMMSSEVPDTLKALSFPVILGGLSFFMREVAFKDNPSGNVMGPVNSVLTLGTGGFFLGFLMGGAAGDGLGGVATGFVGALMGGIAGIIVGCMPSVFSVFNNNPVLYYAPTIISVVIVSVVIFDIWF